MAASSTAFRMIQTPPVLHIRGFSYAYPGRSGPVLDQIDLDLVSGQCALITGATGSGKSTLLLAIRGMLPEGRQTGRLEAARKRTGLVLQNPETQLLRPTVGGECAFALENQCIAPHRMHDIIHKVLSLVNLRVPLSTPVDHLSMGRKYRLLIAAMLVMEPELLLLDEPACQLDPEGIATLSTLLRSLKKRGVAILITGHHSAPFSNLANLTLELKSGKPDPSDWSAADAPAVRAKEPLAENNRPVVEVRGLGFSHDRHRIFADVSFTLTPGERLAVTGRNGAGKSTLLHCLCGFLKSDQGEVRILGCPPDELPAGWVGFHLQDPQRQLFETTVEKEIAFTLKRAGRPEKERRERVSEVMARCGIGHLATQSPYQLSFGQQHLVAVASALASHPALLVLDDPFAGLDPLYKSRLIRVITAAAETSGTAVLYAGHHSGEDLSWAHRHLRMEGGRLVG